MKKLIKILGTGCAKCNTLAAITAEVIRENGLDAELQKIGDIEEILKYQVFATPALVIDEKVVSIGRVPSKPEILAFIEGSD